MASPKLSGTEKEPVKVFIGKNNPASMVEILISVDITKLSETDMIIQSDLPLEIGTNLHFTKPVNMFVNIQPRKAQGKIPEYHGLIHGIGEDHKKELRKFVNTIFFREHDAKVQAESDEFKKLNELKLQQKLEIAKKEAEEKEKEKLNETPQETPDSEK
jgi:hypothetical protein